MCRRRGKSASRTRRRNSASETGTNPMEADSSIHKLTDPTAHSSRTPLHTLVRPTELRPVVPRPSRPLHDLSSDFTHGYHARHCSQENLLLGQTHYISHPYNKFRNRSVPNIVMRDNVSMAPPPILPEERRFRNPYPSVCGCGDSCSCPSCPQHNGTAAANTGVCNTYLDRTIFSLPPSLSPDILPIFDASPAESIDDWVTQVSVLPGDSSGRASQQQQSAWDNYLAPIAEPPSNTEGRYRIQPCCGVFCKCSPETCECDIDCEDGYDCRRESFTPDSISMLSMSDDHAVVTGAFDNIRTAMPINGSDNVGTPGDGLVRSQSTRTIYPGPGPWNVRHFPSIPAVPTTRSRSVSLSLSASSSRSSDQFSSNFDYFSTADDSDFASQPFASFSLPDLGNSLRPRFLSEMPNHLISNPDSYG